ncbi:MAG: hypothetical protein ACR2LQ_05200 [Acidimicrobiales bacterium]
MTGATHVIELPDGDVTPLGARLDAMVAAGGGWVTLLPGVPDEAAPPPQSPLARLFSGQGPPAPVCTWVAPQAKQKPPHVELGILHASGPKAAARLGERGVAIPERWVVLADHPRRGLVIAVPPEVAPGESARWLLAAGAALCRLPMTGSWRAEVYER